MKLKWASAILLALLISPNGASEATAFTRHMPISAASGAKTEAAAPIFPVETNGKIGFINIRGQAVIAPQYDVCAKAEYRETEPSGFDPYTGCPPKYKVVAYKRGAGGIVDPGRAETVKLLNESGTTMYESAEDNWDAYMSSDGTVILRVYANGDDFYEILFDFGKRLILTEIGKYSYIDGRVFDGRRIAYGLDGASYMLNMEGAIIACFENAYFEGYGNGLYCFYAPLAQKAFSVNKNGKELARSTEFLVRPVKDGMFAFSRSEDGPFGLCGTDLSPITQDIYLEITGIYGNGGYIAKRKDKNIVLLGEGGESLTGAYHSIAPIMNVNSGQGDSPRYVGKRANGEKYLLNENGTEICAIPNGWDVYWGIGGAVVMGHLANDRTGETQTGLINVKSLGSDGIADGQWIVPPIYESIESTRAKGYLMAQRAIGGSNVCGIFDIAAGKFINESLFHSISPEYCSGMVIFSAELGGLKGYIEQNGEWVYKASVSEGLELE